jgi:hypothetical protein
MRRAEALVAKSAGLSLDDAISRVFRDDPQRYQRYRKQDSTAPTFGSEQVGRQVGDLYDYFSALQSTMQGILVSEASDKGTKLATALDDFRAAELAKLSEAVPAVTEKRARQHPLADDLLATATALAPQDPTGQGMWLVRKCLAELIAAAKRRAA